MTQPSNVTIQTESVITQTTHPLRVLKAIIQTESVITQSVDATERPMTLIEKLEQELANNSHKFNNQDNGFKAAIDIVRQHEAESEVRDD